MHLFHHASTNTGNPSHGLMAAVFTLGSEQRHQWSETSRVTNTRRVKAVVITVILKTVYNNKETEVLQYWS